MDPACLAPKRKIKQPLKARNSMKHEHRRTRPFTAGAIEAAEQVNIIEFEDDSFQIWFAHDCRLVGSRRGKAWRGWRLSLPSSCVQSAV